MEEVKVLKQEEFDELNETLMNNKAEKQFRSQSANASFIQKNREMIIKLIEKHGLKVVCESLYEKGYITCNYPAFCLIVHKLELVPKQVKGKKKEVIIDDDE